MINWFDQLSDDEISSYLKAMDNNTTVESMLKQEIELVSPPGSIGKEIFQNIQQKSQQIQQKGLFERLWISKGLRLAIGSGLALFTVVIGLIIAGPRIINGRSVQFAMLESGGQVTVMRNNRQVDLYTDGVIYQGDVISTGTDGSLSCVIGEYNNLFIGNDTTLTLSRIPGLIANHYSVDIATGKVLFDIDCSKMKNQFNVKTYLASIIVTGTLFSVEVDEDKTIVAVERGSVNVVPKDSDQDVIQLSAGEMVEIADSTDQIPKEIPISDSARNEFSKHSTSTPDIVAEKKWSLKPVFTLRYKTRPVHSKIIGFSAAGERIAVINEAQIGYADIGSLSKMSVTTFGEEGGMYFKSLPVIMNDTIYAVSVNNRLAVIDTNSNKTESVDLPGFATYGASAVHDKKSGRLLLPLNNGLYQYQTDGTLELISDLSALLTPVLSDSSLYISSYAEPYANLINIEADNSVGWQVSLGEKTYNRPLLHNGFLYIGDEFGGLHRVSLDGTVDKKVLLPAGINASIAVSGKNLYILANDGWLYRVDSVSMKHQKLVQIDKKPEKSVYLYKAPFIDNDLLFVGSDAGTVVIYDTKSGSIVKEITSPGGLGAVTSTVFKYGEKKYLAGCSTGSIIKLEYR